MNPSIYVKKLLDTNNRAHTPSHSDSASLHPHVGLAPYKSKIRHATSISLRFILMLGWRRIKWQK